MQYPSTEVARAAVAEHVRDVKAFVSQVRAMSGQAQDWENSAPLAAPPFPEAGKGSEVPSDTIPTYAYNWCVSPMTPMAVAGVIWVPSESNIGYDPSVYAAELEIYAAVSMALMAKMTCSSFMRNLRKRCLKIWRFPKSRQPRR